MQLVYTDMLDKGFPGMLSTAFTDSNTGTGISEEASAGIPFGVVVARGTAADGVILPAGGTAKLRGLVLHDHTYERGTSGDLDSNGIKPKASISVLEEGRAWVIVEDAVTAGDRLRVRYAGTGQKGAIRKGAVAGETIDTTAQIKARTSAGAGALCEIEVDFMNPQGNADS